MKKRARLKAAMRVRVVCVSAKVAVILVFLVAFFMQCGDIHCNPGPPKSAAKLSSFAYGQSPGSGNKPSSAPEPTIADVVKMLSAMDKKIDSMCNTMQEQMDRVQTDIADVMKENHDLKEKVEKLETKLDDLEGRSRRKNLIFHGIPYPEGRTETWEDCESAVKSVLRDKMGMGDVEVERAHRLKGGKAPHPIIASFHKYKDKERILTERRKLKEKKSDVFINEDFTPLVREKRRRLLPFLKEVKQAKKKAHLRFDTLVVEGKSFVYDADGARLVERRSTR